jgi:glycosyltransferase involved in cell wall biosynthesis
VNPSNPADIAWGIINAVQDPQKRVQLGQNGRRRVLQEFSWDIAAKRTAQLYLELLESKKPKEPR